MNKTIVIEFQGKFGKKSIPKNWPVMNLPGRHIGSYIADTKTDHETIRFRPTGKTAKLNDGSSCELWLGEPIIKQATMIDVRSEDWS